MDIGSTSRNTWRVEDGVVHLMRARATSVPVHIKAEPQPIVVDAARTALVIIDMQNFFCADDGSGPRPSRAPIAPLQVLLPEARAAGLPVLWVNWGTRPDRLNLSPSLHYTFRKKDQDEGEVLISGVATLFKGSEAAAVVPELEIADGDIRIDKHRISGFPDTPLDSILRNLDVSTLLFAGVNMDQCVLATLQDAAFFGYDCVMLEDCVATSSPDFCREATLYNVRRCFGFLATSAAVREGLGAL